MYLVMTTSTRQGVANGFLKGELHPHDLSLQPMCQKEMTTKCDLSEGTRQWIETLFPVSLLKFNPLCLVSRDG